MSTASWLTIGSSFKKPAGNLSVLDAVLDNEIAGKQDAVAIPNDIADVDSTIELEHRSESRKKSKKKSKRHKHHSHRKKKHKKKRHRKSSRRHSSTSSTSSSEYTAHAASNVAFEIDSLGDRSNITYGALDPKKVPAYGVFSKFTRDALGAACVFNKRDLKNIHAEEVAFMKQKKKSGDKSSQIVARSSNNRYFDHENTSQVSNVNFRRFHLATSARRREDAESKLNKSPLKRKSRFDSLRSTAEIGHDNRTLRERAFIAVPPLDDITKPDDVSAWGTRDAGNRLASSPSPHTLVALTESERIEAYLKRETTIHLARIEEARRLAESQVHGTRGVSDVSPEPWLDFVRFQRDAFALRASVKVLTHNARKAQLRLLSEKQAAILRRALDVPGLESNEELWLSLARVIQSAEVVQHGGVQEQGASTEIETFWQQSLLHQNAPLKANPRAWLAYIRFKMDVEFSIDVIRSCFSEALHSTMSSLDVGPYGRKGQGIMALLVTYSEFERGLGYSERALATLQAAFEYHCSVPPVAAVQDKPESVQLKFFQAFWDSEHPRVGDALESGWTHWLQQKAPQLFATKSKSSPPQGWIDISRITETSQQCLLKWWRTTKFEHIGTMTGSSNAKASSTPMCERAPAEAPSPSAHTSSSKHTGSTSTHPQPPSIETRMVYSSVHGFRIPMPSATTQKTDYMRILKELDDVNVSKEVIQDPSSLARLGGRGRSHSSPRNISLERQHEEKVPRQILNQWLAREDRLCMNRWSPVRSVVDPREAETPHRAIFFDTLSSTICHAASDNKSLSRMWGLGIGVEVLAYAGCSFRSTSSITDMEHAKLASVQSLTDPVLSDFFDPRGERCRLWCDGGALLSPQVLDMQFARTYKSEVGSRFDNNSDVLPNLLSNATISRQQFLRRSFLRLLAEFPRCSSLLCAYISFEWQVLTRPLTLVLTSSTLQRMFSKEALNDATILLQKQRQRAREVCKYAFAASPLAKDDLRVWAAFASCEWQYGGDSSSAEKIVFKAMSLAKHLPKHCQREVSLVYWTLADRLLWTRRHRSTARLNERQPETAVAAFILVAASRALHESNSTDIQADISTIKMQCKRLRKGRSSLDTCIVSPPLLLKARQQYLALINSEFERESQIRSLPPTPVDEHNVIGTLPPLLYIAVSAAWLEYIIGGIHAAFSFLQSIIERVIQVRNQRAWQGLTMKEDPTIIYEEWLRMMVLRLRWDHERIGGALPVAFLRSFSQSSLESFPINRFFLQSFASTHKQARMQLQVRQLWNRTVDAGLLPSDAGGTFASLLALVMYVSAAAPGDHALSKSRRLVRFLEDVWLTSANGRQSALIWRLYLAIELITSEKNRSYPKRIKRLYLRALRACPGSRSIWVDAVRQLDGVIDCAQRQQWLESALRRGIRLHSFPEFGRTD